MIFDFDGVIVDSEEPRFAILKKILAEHHVTLPGDAFPLIIGKPTRNFLSEILSKEQDALFEEVMRDYDRVYKQHIIDYVKPISLTVESIKQYEGPLPLAIASMSTKKDIATILNFLGIAEKFSVIVSRDEITHHKPDPEVYLKTAEALSAKPEECVVIEDSVIGAQSALSADMSCYIVLNGINTQAEFVGMKIKGFIKNEDDYQKLLSDI